MYTHVHEQNEKSYLQGTHAQTVLTLGPYCIVVATAIKLADNQQAYMEKNNLLGLIGFRRNYIIV